MDILLISWQGDPEVENVPQEDQILTVSLEAFKHLKKDCMIPVGFTYVGIRDEDHLFKRNLTWPG